MSTATLTIAADPAAAARESQRWAAFQVPWSRHLGTRLATSFPRAAIRLGNLESWLLADRLEPIAIRQPIYVAGLARSGSTVLLEAVAAHRGIATQRCRDFPCLFTPYWWNQFLDRAPRRSVPPRERVHADGLAVSPESPEALEEPLWMAFFPQSHRAHQSSILDAATDCPDFDHFYRNHLRKILLVRGGDRYACKGNYHVARLEYLLKLNPDSRMIVPIRGPREHIASLVKQHRLFTAGEQRYPRALTQMQAYGHFEFGLDRRAIHLDDYHAVEDIERLWRAGEEVRGWARYWAYVHGYLAKRLAANLELRRSTLVVHYEELCTQPAQALANLAVHCNLPDQPAVRATWASQLHAPTYYRPSFSATEEAIIVEETAAVYALFNKAEEDAPATIPLTRKLAATKRAAA